MHIVQLLTYPIIRSVYFIFTSGSSVSKNFNTQQLKNYLVKKNIKKISDIFII